MDIRLTDNHRPHRNHITFDRDAVAPLFPIANRTIGQLCAEHDNLLVFPHALQSPHKALQRQRLLSIVNTDSPDQVQLETDNLMGFFGVDGLQVKISSRFDSNERDYFLHYMLQRTMAFNHFDLVHQHEKEDVFDFLLLLFPYLLKAALRQGLFRAYQQHLHDDRQLRGRIDLNRQLRLHTPFDGRIAYHIRTASHDNEVTQLVRHTIEHLRSLPAGRFLLQIDRETQAAVETIVRHTPSYVLADRPTVIHRALRPKVHPYFTDYQPLQQLCLQILRREQLRYGRADHHIYGVLFDGAWLWEEYLHTLLRDYDFVHPNNHTKQKPIYLFTDKTGHRYPDFYNPHLVLDAKYKRLGHYERVSEVGRDDLHQLMAYMQTLPRQRGGFVAPLSQRPPTPPIAHLQHGQGSIQIFGIEIPQTATTFAEFTQQMQENEQHFMADLNLSPN